MSITSATPGAQIYYTLDGTAPSPTNGTLYTSPLTITGETNVRAIAYAPGYLPSSIAASSYIYVAQVIQQEPQGQVPPGWPSSWGGSAEHYGMAAQVVDNPLYSSEIEQDLLNLPTFSITMNLNDLFSPSTGIYSNPTQEWTVPASIEYITPNGTPGFQADVGLAIHGGADVLSSNDPKRGFRVEFSSGYGASALTYPLFGATAAQSTDEFDLRTDQNVSWQYPGQDPQDYTAIEDAFASNTLAALGQPAEHTFIAALYINGQFWGLYDPIERPDADFGANYLGGSAKDYDVLKSGGYVNGWNLKATSGNMDAWTQLYSEIGQINGSTTAAQADAIFQQVQGNNPDGTPNPSYPVLLNINNLVQYQMLIYYTGNLDAPNSNFLGNENPNNFYALYNDDGSTGFEFVATDSEWTLLDPTTNRVNSEASTPSLTTATPQWFFQQLEQSPEFRQNVADHVQQDFFNNGPLTVQSTTALFEQLAAEASGPVVTESARWGDYQTPGYTYTRDVDWQARIDYDETQYLPVRTGIVVGQLEAAGLFPSVSAPNFSQLGGIVPGGYELTISNPNSSGTIYYTLDGSEPVNAYGVLSSTALAYSGPLTLNQSSQVKAQIVAGGVVSAATGAVFQVPNGLRITELNYDPGQPSGGLADQDNEDYEFIELANFGTETINLQNYAFTNGISYTFGNVTLAPGQVGVLVHNQAAFTSGYYGNTSNLTILGSYQASGSSFSNSGEEVTLVDPVGNVLADFTYSPSWYPDTKGKGPTLEVVDPAANPDLNLAASWRESPQDNGTPGVDDSIPTGAPAGLVGTPGPGQATLAWTAVPGAASYDVYRGTTAGGESPTPVATGLTGLAFIDRGLNGGQTYYYYVTAVDPGGQSGVSGEASVTPQAAGSNATPGFTPGDLIVYRVGNASTPAGTSSAAPVYLDEYTPSGTLVQSIALPSTTSTGLALTDSGKASSDGMLSLDPDGSQIALFGYDVSAGTASATSSTTETVGQVGTAATAQLEAFVDEAGNNAQSAVYDPASGQLYTSGALGLFESSFSAGGTPTTTKIVSGSTGNVQIIGGAVYYASGTSVYSLGGEPTTATTGTAVVSDGTGNSPTQFFFARLGTGSTFGTTGADTLYVADSKAANGTLFKYTWNGSAWSAAGSITGPDSASGNQLLGVTGTVSGSTATIYITEGNTGGGTVGDLYKFSDTFSATLATGTTVLTPLVNVTTNENFHGVVLAPDDGVGTLGGVGGTTGYGAGKPAVAIAPGATFSDASNFMGGSLTATITGGGAAADTLGIAAGSNISLTGTTSGNVLYAGDLVGTYTLSSGATARLTVSFNPPGAETVGNTAANPVSSTAVQALIQQITFATTGASGNRTVSFQVAESGGATDSPAAQTVAVSAHTPPALAANTGLTVAQSSTTTILSSNLSYTSSTDSPANLTYSITTAPTKGTLEKNGSPTASFTQADLNGGLVTYVQNGSDVTSDSFAFTVTDAENSSTAGSFSITIIAPVLVTNATTTVSGGGSVTLGSSVLDTTESGKTSSQLTYTIGMAPAKGTLTNTATHTTLGPGSTFTQTDLNNGLITYANVNAAASADSFTFSVTDGAGARPAPRHFPSSSAHWSRPFRWPAPRSR